MSAFDTKYKAKGLKGTGQSPFRFRRAKTDPTTLLSEEHRFNTWFEVGSLVRHFLLDPHCLSGPNQYRSLVGHRLHPLRRVMDAAWDVTTISPTADAAIRGKYAGIPTVE